MINFTYTLNFFHQDKQVEIYWKFLDEPLYSENFTQRNCWWSKVYINGSSTVLGEVPSQTLLLQWMREFPYCKHIEQVVVVPYYIVCVCSRSVHLQVFYHWLIHRK